MATLRNANDICELVLRKIGALSINDTGADSLELDVCLHLLDLHMSYLAGTEFSTWLIPQPVSIDLTGGEASFDLIDRMGASLPTDGFQFLYDMELEISGVRTTVELVDREEFDRLCKPATTGKPEIAHLDRRTTPTLRLYPYPESGEDSYNLILTFQTFSADVLPKSKGPTRGGNIPTGLRKAWELWAVETVAAAAADGPVRRLPTHEVDRMYARAELYKDRLITWENREALNGPPIIKSWRVI